MEKIICGFAGIGKSTCAKNIAGVVDLESTPFHKNWGIYSEVAQHMANNGYTVLLSCHKELRKYLIDKKIDFITILPEAINNHIDSKTIYLKRYKERGNTQEFIDFMSNNWGEFNTTLQNENVITLGLDKYLIDIIPSPAFICK